MPMFFKKDVKLSLSLSHKKVDFHTSHKGFTLIELLIVTLFRKSPDGQVGIKSHKKGFTLIELLIVIGILAVLATVTLLVLNPAQMFAEARDASRISDMDTINKALLYYQGVGGINLGLPNKVYISIPSSYADCGYSESNPLALPALGTGYVYVCSDQAHYRNADGTGWIPVDFTSTQGTLGALLTSLPVDPVNTVANGFYYTYISGSWALSATMESQKYLSEKAPSDGGSVSTRFEVGNEIALDSTAGLGSGGAICGNNIKEIGETCDGTDLNSQTCATQLGVDYTGTLSCHPSCSSFVTTSCVNYTVLLLHMDGTNNSTIFADSSPHNRTITPYGNVRIDTSQSKFGGSSAYFDGSGDYLTVPDSNDWNFGGGNFTIDFWVRFNSVASQMTFVSQPSGAGVSPVLLDFVSQKFRFLGSATGSSWDVNVNGTTSLAINTWYHLALVRNGANWSIYLNGVKEAETTSAVTLFDSAAVLSVGANGSGLPLNGWIDEFRISMGVARWTSNFIPPTSPY